MNLTQNPETIYTDFLSRLNNVPVLSKLDDFDCNRAGVFKYLLPPEGVVLKYSDGMSEANTLVIRCQQLAQSQLINIKLYDEYDEEVVTTTVYHTLGGSLEDVIVTVLMMFGYGLFARAFFEYYESNDYPVPTNLYHKEVEGNVNMYELLSTPAGVAFIDAHNLKHNIITEDNVVFNNLVIPLKDITQDNTTQDLCIKCNANATISTYSVLYRQHMIFSQFGNMLKQFNTLRQILNNELYNPDELQITALEEIVAYNEEFATLIEALTMMYKVDYQNRINEMNNQS